jgi:citrate lyase subunit beta/citryl-CoA lyase
MLYVPANSWRMINRIESEVADAVILDLEDAVPTGEKETGRIFARDAVPLLENAGFEIFIRVNSMATGLAEEDVSYVVGKGLAGIMLPKSETKEDVIRLEQLLEEGEKRKGLEPDSIGILPLVESPGGVQKVFDIASASSRTVGLAFGAADFLREMGVGFAVTRLSFAEYYPLLLYARSRVSQAARVARIEAIDTPFFGLLTDIKGISEEAEAAKLLGFTGKQIVHPRQIEPVNRVFTPSQEDVDYARAIVAAYNEAVARGAGTASFGGKMIDYVMYDMGLDMIYRAEAAAKKPAIRS